LHGCSNDSSNGVAAQYLNRSPLGTSDRPELTCQANSGLGNAFLLFGPATVTHAPMRAAIRPSRMCQTETGGIIISQANGERCGLRYGPRFNRVNEEERSHLNGYVKHDLDSAMVFNAEAMWAKIEVLDNPQSPSYPALAFLTRPIAAGEAGNPFGTTI
jgi:iron complex outermembrane receptor protein